MKEEIKLPKILSIYNKSDYSTQQKARFIFYLCISAVIGLFFLTLSTSYVQIISKHYNGIHYPVIITEIIALILFVVCLLILLKGNLNISSYLFISIATLCVWIVMYFDYGETISRIDTVVIILALLSMIPLFTTKFRSSIFIYVIINIVILIVFVWFFKDQMELSTSTAIDYVVDTSIAMIFAGIVGYNIYRINKQSLEKAESDNVKLKKVDEALWESEQRYRTLFENAQIGIYQSNRDGKFLQANPALIKMLGFDSFEELSDKNYNEENAYIDSSRKAIIELFEKNGFIKDFESKWKKKNNEIIYIKENSRVVKDKQGKVIYYEGFVENITERKNAEKESRENKQLFETLAQVAPVGVFRTRPDGYTTYVNPKWSELSGLKFEEALGDGWIKAVHPDDRELLKNNWNQHSKKGKKSKAAYRFLKKDGTIVWVLGYAVPEIVDSKIQGFIGTITDITELKKFEKNLKESEERNRTIVEAFPDIIMISDLKKNIIFANDMLEKVTGISKDDYTNPNRKAHIHPDDSPIVQKAIVNLLKGDKQHTDIIENRFIDTWGKEHWFSGIISKMTLNNEIVLQTITRDITKRKTVEKELEKYRNHLEILVKDRTEELAASNEELTSTNEELHLQREELEAVLLNLQNTQKQLVQAEKMASLGVLASGVAHEINNPLNFIKGGAFGIEQYIKENLIDHKDELFPLLEGINTGINRAANIVTSLNHYNSRSDSNFAQCDIHSIIDNCLVILRNQISKRIEIKKDYSQDSYSLNGNEGKLHQAMLNILSNAVQSIDDKGFITIRTSISTKKMSIIISDSGCGISAQNLPKILDPFFTTKEPGKGTGLGLSITYNILEEHNGTIDFESKEGEGTTVKIILPIKKE